MERLKKKRNSWATSGTDGRHEEQARIILIMNHCKHRADKKKSKGNLFITLEVKVNVLSLYHCVFGPQL